MISRTQVKSDWWLPAALLILVAVPVAAGAVRLAQLIGGVATPENARFFAMPVPVVLHIVSASVFCTLGAFQFVPNFRRRNPSWHRRVGQVLIACGLTAGFTGLWMTWSYPPAENDGELLTVFRFFFGSAMVVCIALSFVAARRKYFSQHRAWMTRGYAIGMGAGTQFLVHIPWLFLRGKPDVLERALLMGAAWVINLAVAEWSLRRASPRASAPLETSTLTASQPTHEAAR
jgi:uncharacterized membrane protein